jgi:hypothetical protein
MFSLKQYNQKKSEEVSIYLDTHELEYKKYIKRCFIVLFVQMYIVKSRLDVPRQRNNNVLCIHYRYRTIVDYKYTKQMQIRLGIVYDAKKLIINSTFT